MVPTSSPGRVSGNGRNVEMNRADITIIGAGVVGLAIAAQIASAQREVYLLEKNETFGLETSSRHSGVIHAGIYYPPGSLKASMCRAGNRALYDLCEVQGIGYRKNIIGGSNYLYLTTY